MLPAPCRARIVELNKHTRGSNEEAVGCAKKHAARQGEKREEIARAKIFWLTHTGETGGSSYWTGSFKFVKDDEAKSRKTYATIYSARTGVTKHSDR
ncbi:MAG TPA: hypothetical protein VFZ23_13620 [Pyrinomonadaceae bacterium]